MKSLSSLEMETVSGGFSAAGCLVGTVVGMTSIVLIGLGTAGVGVTLASLALAELSPVFGCLL